MEKQLDFTHLSNFARQVYSIVAIIPAGRVTTYGSIAIAIGQKGAARAVGQCLAANPIPEKVPCHRVVGHDGQLTGFFSSAKRLDLKREMLEREGVGFKNPSGVKLQRVDEAYIIRDLKLLVNSSAPGK